MAVSSKRSSSSAGRIDVNEMSAHLGIAILIDNVYNTTHAQQFFERREKRSNGKGTYEIASIAVNAEHTRQHLRHVVRT